MERRSTPTSLASESSPQPENPRAVLARYGFDPKKSWGQNFLCDRNVHERIVRAVAAGSEDTVVEIGAGLGTLTAALAAAPSAPRRILAIERDPDMLTVLNTEFGNRPPIEIRAADAVQFDFAAVAREAGRPVIVVGNLPYQITSALLFAIVDAGAAVARAIVMVQREFADRVVAPPGSKTYGRLSVMVQQRMETRRLFDVQPGSFFPRPRIVSAVLSIARRSVALAAVRDQALFARVVKEAFSTRRKMLRRSLGDAFGDTAAAAALETSAIAGTRRPEELSVAEFGRLSDALAGSSPATRADANASTEGSPRRA